MSESLWNLFVNSTKRGDEITRWFLQKQNPVGFRGLELFRKWIIQTNETEMKTLISLRPSLMHIK